MRVIAAVVPSPLPLLMPLAVFASTVLAAHPSFFPCPLRCQCYGDNVTSISTIHLICKWEQLNSSNLETITLSDPVRTLTIRCPHGSKAKSSPPAGLFSRLRNLDRLEIDRCKIEYLHNRLFEDMSQLYTLIIKNAALTQLPSDLFRDLSNLMVLDLTGNDLRIEPYALISLSNLIQLDLSRNSMRFVSNTLQSLHRLKLLSLDENQLTNVDLRRFPQSLTDLSLRNNLINTLHFIPDGTPSLRRLDLAGNQLDFVSATGTVNVLPSSLRSVDLSGNRIRFIQDGAFAHITKLAMLDLRNNSLVELREAAVTLDTALKHRVRVQLAGNPLLCSCSLRWIVHPPMKNTALIVDLRSVHCTHALVPNLRMSLIDADGRGELLCKYDASCANECNCCFEKLCYCRSVCPPGCVCWHSAAPHVNRMGRNVVECNGARLDYITEIPQSVTELRIWQGLWKEWRPSKIGAKPELLVLNITNSNLPAIEESFLDGFPKLMHLDLSGNKLGSFPDAQLDQVVNLESLFLNDNRLTEFSAISLKRLSSIRRLKFGGSGNIYHCSCDQPFELQKWLMKPENRRKVLDYDQIVCTLKNAGVVHMREMDPSARNTRCSHLTTIRSTPTTTSTIVVTSTTPKTSSTTRSWWTQRSSKRRVGVTARPRPAKPADSTVLFTIVIFLLLLLLVCLLIAIGATVYFRYCRIDKKLVKKQPPTSATQGRKCERQPLNS